MQTARTTPITTFLIPSGGQTIPAHVWHQRQPNAVWYGLPEENEYRFPTGGTYRRCRVEAFNNEKESLGYLPLPSRYADRWIQLCYSVVYWMTQWKAWMEELGTTRIPGQPADFVQQCMCNCGTRLLKYLTARRLIIDELLKHDMSQDGSDELLVFDEYIIRDRFDWLWTEYNKVPKRDLKYLGLDPVHPNNRATFTHRNPKLVVPEEMLPPVTSPRHTWIWGEMNHFDHKGIFEQGFRDVLTFYKSKALRKGLEDMPFSANDQGFPDRWHEDDWPAVEFLTEEEDRLFGHPDEQRGASAAFGTEQSAC